MYIRSVTSSVELPVGISADTKSMFSRWDGLRIPTMLIALPGHWFWWPGADAGRECSSVMPRAVLGFPWVESPILKASMAGWVELCIPTVLIALPDHALLRSGAMALMKGKEPRVERLVMGEGG